MTVLRASRESVKGWLKAKATGITAKVEMEKTRSIVQWTDASIPPLPSIREDVDRFCLHIMPTGVVGDSIDGTLGQREAEEADVNDAGKGTHEMDPLTRANLGAAFNSRQSDIFSKRVRRGRC